jgi:hypothetical protein
MIDPRNPPDETHIPTDSDHPAHKDICKTLVLLSIGKIYFVVEGLCKSTSDYDELQKSEEYFYNEHTCPTNFIPILMIAHNGDLDPHGLFRFIESVWMTTEYVASTDKDKYLTEIFPQLKEKSIEKA